MTPWAGGTGRTPGVCGAAPADGGAAGAVVSTGTTGNREVASSVIGANRVVASEAAGEGGAHGLVGPFGPAPGGWCGAGAAGGGGVIGAD